MRERRRLRLQELRPGHALLLRFISENLTVYLNESERKAGHADCDYAALSDEDAELGRRETVVEKGFYSPVGPVR